MIKIVALLALVAVSSQALKISEEGEHDPESFSELASIIPTTEQEVEGLTGSQKLFQPFCLDVKSTVFGDARHGFAAVLRMLMNSVIRTTTGAVEDLEETKDKIASQIANPEAFIQPSDGTVASEIMYQGQKSMANSGFAAKALYLGMITLLRVGGARMFASATLKNLEAMQASLGATMFSQYLQDACNSVAKYDEEFTNNFEQYKEAIIKAQPEIESQVKDLTYGQLECVTAYRVAKLNYACQLSMNLQPTVAGMMRRYFGRVGY